MSHVSWPSSQRSSGYDNLVQQPGSGPDWERTNHFPTPPVRQSSVARFGATIGMRQLEESLSVRHNYTSSSIGRRYAFTPFPPVQRVFINSTGQETESRMASFLQNPSPRFPGLQHNAHSNRDREDSTKRAREKALKMLKKEIYSSEPKNLSRRLSLYYSDIAGNNNTAIRVNDKETNEDIKRCAICLDDFEPGTEVMVTPCNHMFHEECIVPWMKSHGQCPVCRFVISEQIKANAMA